MKNLVTMLALAVTLTGCTNSILPGQSQLVGGNVINTLNCGAYAAANSVLVVLNKTNHPLQYNSSHRWNMVDINGYLNSKGIRTTMVNKPIIEKGNVLRIIMSGGSRHFVTVKEVKDSEESVVLLDSWYTGSSPEREVSMREIKNITLNTIKVTGYSK